MIGKFLRIAILAGFSLFSSALLANNDQGDADLTIEGELTVIHADDFVNHRAEHFFSVKDARSGEVYDIRFEDERVKRHPPARMRTGSKVRIKGRRTGREIFAAANGESVETLQIASAAVSGEQRAVVLLINFQDAALECSASSVQTLMFSPTQQSVDRLYREMSYGNVWFTGDVYGPFTVPYSSGGSCDYSGWASAAEAAAQAAGVNLGQYNRKVYVFPSNSPCSWAGLGTVGGNPSRAWIAYCDLPDVYAHELGHNLTMQHASTDTDNNGASDCEYCDTSDIMGYGGVGWRQIDGPHKEQMGWLPTNKVVVANSSATYYIAPTELYPQTTPYPQLLKIAKPGTGEYYYFSYRRQLGYDASLLSQYADKVSVHRYRGSGATQTYFIKALSNGGSFQDSAAGFSVTQLSHNNDFVTLFVSFGCNPAAPATRVSPATQTSLPGTTLTFSVTVTNADSTSCGASTFLLSPSVAAGWAASVSPTSLTLSPGQGGPATLTVTVPAGATTGNYSVGVTVADNFLTIHNASVTGAVSIQAPQSSPPTTPTNLTVTSRRRRVYLLWSPATDDVKVVKYSIWRAGVKIGESRGIRYTDARVTAGSSYSYYVTAQDADGNTSDPSNVATTVAFAGRLPSTH